MLHIVRVHNLVEQLNMLDNNAPQVLCHHAHAVAVLDHVVDLGHQFRRQHTEVVVGALLLYVAIELLIHVLQFLERCWHGPSLVIRERVCQGYTASF